MVPTMCFVSPTSTVVSGWGMETTWKIPWNHPWNVWALPLSQPGCRANHGSRCSPWKMAKIFRARWEILVAHGNHIGSLSAPFCVATSFGFPGRSTAAPGPVPHSEPQGWQHHLDLGCYAPITREASGAVAMSPHHGWVDSHHMPSLIHTNLIFMEFGKILMC